jgi:hypothetical protein
MDISLLNEVRINDQQARIPGLFSTLPFVPTESQGQPVREILHRSVSASDTVTATHRQFEKATAENTNTRSGSLADAQPRARFVSHDLMGQDVPSANSITVIAGLTERAATPSSLIVLYELTAQPDPVNHTAKVA